PGISSAIAAPASIGIPVTKRGVNESFWVITGMLASGKLSKDINLAAQSSATVIILMGMTHIQSIMKIFEKYRSSLEPAAVIQHATTFQQKAVTGNISNICNNALTKGITSPAVIIIGKVVNESHLTKILDEHELIEKRAM